MERQTARAILVSALLLLASALQAQFNPPQVVRVMSSAQGRLYFIDRGLDASIKVGDVLNVFRVIGKKTADGQPPERLFLGTMEITNSEAGVSTGRYIADEAIKRNPMIRMKHPVRGDLVIPKLKIDSSVLFEPGAANLQLQVVREELDKVVQFVRSFNPSKLTIEGHTDSDGDEQANQTLSVQRAEMVAGFLVSNYEEITTEMVTAKGFGETRPIVTNDTPANRALNRRIEIVVLE